MLTPRQFGTVAVRLHLPVEELAKVEKMLSGLTGALPKAACRAIDRGTRHMRTMSSKVVRDETGVPIRRILKRIWVNRSLVSTLMGKTRLGAVDWPAIFAGPRQIMGKGGGVFFRFSKEMIRHAFIQRMPTGHLGVFIRKDLTRRGLPIRGLKTKSATQAVLHAKADKRIHQEGLDVLAKRLPIEAMLILEGHRYG